MSRYAPRPEFDLKPGDVFAANKALLGALEFAYRNAGPKKRQALRHALLTYTDPLPNNVYPIRGPRPDHVNEERTRLEPYMGTLREYLLARFGP